MTHLVVFGVLGACFYLTVLFVPDELRPLRPRGQRMVFGAVLVLWYGLTPVLYWHRLAALPHWAAACSLIGTGFGVAAGLLVMRARQRVVS